MSHPLPDFPSLDDRLRMALAEDLGPAGLAGDITAAAIFGDGPVPEALGGVARALIRAKAPGVISGAAVARRVFELLAAEDSLAAAVAAPLVLDVRADDGAAVGPGGEVMRLEASARLLLAGERTALNLLQRLSGIATLTRACVAEAGGALRVVDTRKTTPLWRDLEKQAVVHGGGRNHRHGLYDAYMIKDNHIAAAGGVTAAIERVLAHRSAHRRAAPDARVREIVVEVRTLDELREALPLVDRDTYLMLDNMRGAALREALELVAGRARTELSGNYGPGRLGEVAALGATRVSLGCLTHSAPALDLSMAFAVG
jgi:nicotinate-nucleotide pyrophosphorylase (carboxylating)